MIFINSTTKKNNINIFQCIINLKIFSQLFYNIFYLHFETASRHPLSMISVYFFKLKSCDKTKPYRSLNTFCLVYQHRYIIEHLLEKSAVDRPRNVDRKEWETNDKVLLLSSTTDSVHLFR